MARISFSVLCALCIMASLCVHASAACSMFKYPRQFIKPVKDNNGQWKFAAYAQERVDKSDPKYCLDKCNKDKKCEVVKIDTKHLVPGLFCRPNPNGCPPKLKCEYFSEVPVTSDGVANYDVELAFQEQYQWGEKIC